MSVEHYRDPAHAADLQAVFDGERAFAVLEHEPLSNEVRRLRVVAGPPLQCGRLVTVETAAVDDDDEVAVAVN